MLGPRVSLLLMADRDDGRIMCVATGPWRRAAHLPHAAAELRRVDAWQVPDSTYRLTNGIEVAATGADSAQILASFTDAGVARILQNGPQAENTDWTPVAVAGVSLFVPPNWKVKDLPHQDFSQGFSPNPAADHGAWFYSVVPRVFIGKADPNIVTAGLAVDQWPIAAVDAAWEYEIPDDTANIGPVIASGTTNCLRVSVVERTLPDNNSIDPVLDLIVRSADHTVRVSIGVGPDASIARTILRSIHAS